MVKQDLKKAVCCYLNPQLNCQNLWIWDTYLGMVQQYMQKMSEPIVNLKRIASPCTTLRDTIGRDVIGFIMTLMIRLTRTGTQQTKCTSGCIGFIINTIKQNNTGAKDMVKVVRKTEIDGKRANYLGMQYGLAMYEVDAGNNVTKLYGVQHDKAGDKVLISAVVSPNTMTYLEDLGD